MPRRALDVQELTRAPRVRGLARAIEIGTTVFLRAPAAGDRDEFLALRRRSRRFLAPWEARPAPGDADPSTVMHSRRWQDHEHWAMTVEDWRARGAGRHDLLAPRGKPRVD